MGSNNIEIVRLNVGNGIDVIGEWLGTTKLDDLPFHLLIIRQARMIVYQPAPGGVCNIGFSEIWRVPAVVGVEELDKKSLFNANLFIIKYKPNANILSAYLKATTGIFTPSHLELTPSDLTNKLSS